MKVSFAIGEKPLKSLRLIEKHFFKGKVISTHDFATGFCVPNSENEWETIYDLPKFNEEQTLEIIHSPGETTSDSYFFVEDKLIIH